MRVPQLLDLPRLSFRSDCIRHHGSKTTQCRNHHHHALLQRLPKCIIKASHQTGPSPISRYRTSHKPLHTPALHRSVQHHQRRTLPLCTLLHHSCHKAAHRIRTRTASIEQATPATLSSTAAVTGHGYHRCRDRRKRKTNGKHKTMQGAAVNNCGRCDRLPCRSL
jgi:hypothetical protein